MKTLLLLIIISIFASNAMASDSVDGFRGIKWGTDISKDENFTKSGNIRNYGGIDLYTKQSDTLTIGDAQLKSITYANWNSKFSTVRIVTNGRLNFSLLLASCEEKLGKAVKNNPYIENYVWRDDVTQTGLSFNKITEEGVLFMISRKIFVEQQEYEKTKAKEGAKKDF